jgi:hypothetical protein
MIPRRGLLGVAAFLLAGAARAEELAPPTRRPRARAIAELPPAFWREFQYAGFDEASPFVGENRAGWVAAGSQRVIARTALANLMLGNPALAERQVALLARSLEYREPDTGRFRYERIRGTRLYEFSRALTAAFLLVDVYQLAHAAALWAPRSGLAAAAASFMRETAADYAAIRDTALQTAALNVQAPNRVILLMRCLWTGARLLPDPEGRAVAADLLGISARLQLRDGLFPEVGGPDLGYQMVSLLQLGLLRYVSDDTVMEVMMARGADWVRARIRPDGRLDFTGSTRTSDNPAGNPGTSAFNQREVLATLLLLERQTGDAAFGRAWAELAGRLGRPPVGEAR